MKILQRKELNEFFIDYCIDVNTLTSNQCSDCELSTDSAMFHFFPYWILIRHNTILIDSLHHHCDRCCKVHSNLRTKLSKEILIINKLIESV